MQFELAFVYYKIIVEIHGEWDNTVFLDEKERKKQMLTINLMWLCVRACAHCGQGSLFVMIIFYRILCWITHSLWSFYCTLFGKMLAIYRLIFFFGKILRLALQRENLLNDKFRELMYTMRCWQVSAKEKKNKMLVVGDGIFSAVIYDFNYDDRC